MGDGIMVEANQAADEAIKATIGEIIERRLGYSPKHLEVLLDEDFEGDPILRVEVEHPFRDDAVDPELTYGLTGEVREALERNGEYRFPLIRHHFHQDQAVAS